MARYSFNGVEGEASVLDSARRMVVPIAVVALVAWAIALWMQDTFKHDVLEAYEPGDALKHMKRFQDGGE